MSSWVRVLRLGTWLKTLWGNAVILYYAWRHPLTPKYLKGIMLTIMIYLISPIDLLPDYLPLVGIADDSAVITVAMLFLTNLLPAPVLAEGRRQSEKWVGRMPYIIGAIVVAAAAWIVFLIAIVRKVFLA